VKTAGPERAPEAARAERFFSLCEQAERRGTGQLSDADVLLFLAEQRWAVARLSSTRTPLRERSVLNAASLKAHSLLYARPGERARLADGLRRVAGALGLAFVVFVACAVAAFLAVRAEPTLAYGIVPRELLSQISPSHWGSRDGVSESIGMTFFYWGNNLRASFFCLSLGALAGVMALVPLAFNAAVLGAVAAASEQRGALGALLAWIAPHAVPELGALILCSAIGLELGRSWLSPGWHTRRRSAALAGRQLGPVIALAAALVVLAAPLEGFVAPLDLPAWLDATLPLSWLLLLGLGAWRALRSSPQRPPDAATAARSA
jgi:uncharacterized membrane protein SpoIIM required for sporulation